MQLILVINRRTRIEYYANKFSTLIPIKPLGFTVHGLCFLGVNVFAIEGMLNRGFGLVNVRSIYLLYGIDYLRALDVSGMKKKAEN